MKHLLIALLTGLNCIACFGQFNKNYSISIDSYKDAPTIKATKLVNEEEIMTVGYAKEAESKENVNDIVIIKTKQEDGKVIWAKKYGLDGLDEKGFGLTVSYDKRHIIVCGSAQNRSSRTDWNALVMKINISTGDVVWSSQLGEIRHNEEFRMVEKSYANQAAVVGVSGTYMLVGSNSYYEDKKTLYAASVYDHNGSSQWSNYYANRNTLDNIDDFAFSMVQAYANQFYICGTRKDEDKSRIFTLRINPYAGNLTYSYVLIHVNNLYRNNMNQYGGAICKVNWSRSPQIGFAIACTSTDPQVGRGGFVEEAITMLILDQKGKSEYGGLYWERAYKGNRGLSVYQSSIKQRQHTLDVYTNTFNETYQPGFMNINISGTVNYFQKYDDSEGFDDKLPTSMVKNQYGYTAKVLNTNPEQGSRFQLAQLGQDGRTACMREENMLYQPVETEEELIEYVTTAYSRSSERAMESKDIEVRAGGCGGEEVEVERAESTQKFSKMNSLSEISVHPNPASGAVKVSIEGGNVENGSVVLMSSTGSILCEKRLALDYRTVEFDMVQLPSGIYIVQFTDALGNTEVKKVIKQ